MTRSLKRLVQWNLGNVSSCAVYLTFNNLDFFLKIILISPSGQYYISMFHLSRNVYPYDFNWNGSVRINGFFCSSLTNLICRWCRSLDEQELDRNTWCQHCLSVIHVYDFHGDCAFQAKWNLFWQKVETNSSMALTIYIMI